MGGGNDLLMYYPIANVTQMADDMRWFLIQAREMGYKRIHVGNLPNYGFTPYFNLNRILYKKIISPNGLNPPNLNKVELIQKMEDFNKYLEQCVQNVNES